MDFISEQNRWTNSKVPILVKRVRTYYFAVFLQRKGLCRFGRGIRNKPIGILVVIWNKIRMRLRIIKVYKRPGFNILKKKGFEIQDNLAALFSGLWAIVEEFCGPVS